MRTPTGATRLFLLLVLLLFLSVEQGSQPSLAAGQNLVYIPGLYKPLPELPKPSILTIIQLPAGSHPHGIALDTNNQRAFVGNNQSNTLSIVDTAAMSLLQTVNLSGAIGPNGVAYHSQTDRVYVANRETGNVSLVDPTAAVWLQNITAGNLPDGVLALDDRIYVANFGSDSVTVIDSGTNTVVNTIPVGQQPAMLAEGDAGTFYLTSYGDNTLYYLNANGVFNSHPNVPAPYGLAYDPITFRLFAVNRGLAGGLTLVDVSPNAPAGEIDVSPKEAYVVAVNPRTGHIFVVCGDEVKIYDRRDNEMIISLPVGGGSEEGIAVDVIRNLVYVTNSDANTVTVIQDTLTYDVAYTAWKNTGQLINVDDTGQHERPLSEPDMHYSQPDWRPDGRYLVVGVFSYLTGEYDIFRMESGGQNKINLTAAMPETEDLQPVWSPNGQQIAWRRDWRIWLMDADGGNKLPLTPQELGARDPKWSPDGQWISFVAWDGAHEDVFIIPAAGGAPINVTNHPEVDLNQSWSADSQEMAFESFRDGNWEIYKANIADPENILLTRLTDVISNDHGAAWSEDGLQIAFISDRDNSQYDYTIWLMDTDGSNQRRLTMPRVFLGPMSWSPDSRWLLSRAGYGFESQIYKIDALTGAVYQLSNTGFTVDNPIWRPDSW